MKIERDANHKYTIDDQPVPGVSEILQGVGYVDTRYFDAESRQRGTAVHKVCELWDKGTPIPGLAKFPELHGYLEAWKKFRAEAGFKPEEIEYVVGHPALMYAGTLDRLGDMDGSNLLVDIKTGTPAWWHPIQTAAYGGMVMGTGPRMGVYLRGNGDYRIESHNDYMDWDRFVWALNIWKEKEPHGLNRRDD